ncbi:hypothetical protein O5623_06700 [Escherichia coli]|nr:hypothetical protein [Escherichia coli]
MPPVSGTPNVQDQDSVITVRRLYNGYFGNGTVNISNNGLINNKKNIHWWAFRTVPTVSST